MAVALVGGCSAAAQNAPSRGDRNLVTNEQLTATNSVTVFDALEKLRPEWMTSRGPTSVTDATPTTPSVFMNGQMLGRIDVLREIRVVDVAEARFWAAGQASARFGMGHPRGVIELKSR
jgi:GDP-D-mannose dehydratase